ncbi:recombinase family protein [Vibrio sp. Vb1574]|uniref:recombinase family protein n=1 Tax=Vibrio sp. Vb1574 TaxID=3074643 RepID=UPI00296497BC|nr:recombinase family protein [Vibrio sp. Vb1574]MDW1888308.1 recombinase family protein [Vibrio sp. Vb1574]
MKHTMYSPKQMTSLSECLEAIQAIETHIDNYKKADHVRFRNGEHCTVSKAAQKMIDRLNARADELCPDEEEYTAPTDNSIDVGYVRTSTDKQSIAGQVESIKEMCPHVELYTDEGVSGTVPVQEREQLPQLLAKLRKGDRLWVWWIDRLGRNSEEIEMVVRDLLHRGVTIRTVNQGMTFSPFTGDAMRDLVQKTQLLMITAMAEAERMNRLQSAEDGRRAMRNGAKSKKGLTWSEAFKGRKADTDKHKRIMELLGQGMSIRAVAKEVGCSTTTVQTVKKQHS